MLSVSAQDVLIEEILNIKNSFPCLKKLHN